MPWNDELKGLGYLSGSKPSSTGKDLVVFALTYRANDPHTRFRFTFAGVTFNNYVQKLFPGAKATLKSFRTEADLRNIWSGFADDWRRGQKRVAAGILVSHASAQPMRGTSFGIEAQPDANTDGTLTPREIAGLGKLPWHPRGWLILCGCDTGKPSASGMSVAKMFSTQQGVVTIGQTAKASFSRRWDRFEAHTGSDTSEEVYLWGYDAYAKSAFGVIGATSHLGSGDRLPGKVERLCTK